MIKKLGSFKTTLGEVRKIPLLKVRDIDETHVIFIKEKRQETGYEDDFKVAFIKEINKENFIGGTHLLYSMSDEPNSKVVYIQRWEVDTIEEAKGLGIGSNILKQGSRYDYAKYISSCVNKNGKEKVIKESKLSSSVIDDYCLISKLPLKYTHLLIESINTSRATVDHPLTNEHIKVANKYFGVKSNEVLESLQFLEKGKRKRWSPLSVNNYEKLLDMKAEEPYKTFDELNIERKKEEKINEGIIIDEISKEHYLAYDGILKNTNPSMGECDYVMDIGAKTLNHIYKGEKIPSTSLSLFNNFNGDVILIGRKIFPELKEYASNRGKVQKYVKDWKTVISFDLSVNKSKGIIIWDQLSWTVSPNLIEMLLYKRPCADIILTILDPFREEPHECRHRPESLTELFGVKYLSMNTFNDYLKEFSRLLKEKSISFRIVFRNERLVLAILKK